MLWTDPVILLSVLWVAGELLLIARRRPSEADSKGADRGSFGVIIVVMWTGIGAGVWMGMSGIGRLPGGVFLPMHYGHEVQHEHSVPVPRRCVRLRDVPR